MLRDRNSNVIIYEGGGGEGGEGGRGDFGEGELANKRAALLLPPRTCSGRSTPAAEWDAPRAQGPPAWSIVQSRWTYTLGDGHFVACRSVVKLYSKICVSEHVHRPDGCPSFMWRTPSLVATQEHIEY